MVVLWGDIELCHTTHHVELNALTGDLDLDGHVGASDVLPLLSALGCSQGCAGDLDGDQSVTISDLLVRLTAVGQSCL